MQKCARKLSTWWSLGCCVLLVVYATAADSTAEEASPQPPIHFPGLTLDRANQTIDLQATVVQRDADWLELVACTPKSREHEALVTVAARPSDVHAALLLLGLQPGAPMQWKPDDDAAAPDAARKFQTTPPTGPPVGLWFVYDQDGDGELDEVPANTWVLDEDTGKPLADNTWLFAGSALRTVPPGPHAPNVKHPQELYMADLNGTVASLVSFGDDLIARATTVTHMNDGERYTCHTAAIPPLGTAVILRIRSQAGDGADEPD